MQKKVHRWLDNHEDIGDDLLENDWMFTFTIFAFLLFLAVYVTLISFIGFYTHGWVAFAVVLSTFLYLMKFAFIRGMKNMDSDKANDFYEAYIYPKPKEIITNALNPGIENIFDKP